MLHGDDLPSGRFKHPGTEALRRELKKIKSPHIIEGVQVMGLRPKEVAGHDVRIIEPSRKTIVSRLMRRGWEPTTGVPRYDRKGAMKLYDEMSQNLSAFRGRLHKE